MHSKGRVRVTEIEYAVYPYNFKHFLSGELQLKQFLQSVVRFCHSFIHSFSWCTYHGYQLGELQLEVDGDSLTDVGHGSHQLVVVGQQVVIQSLGVRVPTLHLGVRHDQQGD